jgi:heterodisulfide reductase subunit A-like polyferredoxin
MAKSEEGTPEKRPVGAVAVIGAGIGGMQAALDLADGGFKVYLADAGPAIGGTMAQLDKTFPTNDCAMCIMSPKLVETGRHLNIEILTMAEVVSLGGEPGDFTLRLRKKPRFVDTKTCTGCGDCAAACPIQRPDPFNANLSMRKAIYRRYPQAIPNAFAIEKRGEAPCRHACPIEQRAMGYVALVREGRFADAYRTIRQDNPFPSVCGRVCNHRCEDDCSRATAGDTAVSIMRLKRFVSDWARSHPDEIQPMALALAAQGPNAGRSPLEALQGARVAVVGSGPAGLTCAADLARLGCRVTVFEALPVPGGMMRVGIPAYRLPVVEVQSDVSDVLSLGIELVLNHRVEDASELLAQDFQAVFVAVGAPIGQKLRISGHELPGVLLATEFLRAVSLQSAGLADGASAGPGGQRTPTSEDGTGVMGKRVLVIGGGNVAIDAAMTALRLGALWVGMACLESREKMPAHDWEVRDAEAEGIQVYPARTFKEITGSDDAIGDPGTPAAGGTVSGDTNSANEEPDGRAPAPATGGTARGRCWSADAGNHVTGVRTARIIFRGFVGGRPDFDEVPGGEELIPCDVVIFAIGQRPDLALLPGEAQAGRRTIAVEGETLATQVPGIFAGGDAVTGTAFVVDAIASGHRAARSISAYLCQPGGPVAVWPPALDAGERPAQAVLDPQEARALLAAKPDRRAEPRKRPANERKRDFGEIEAALTEQEAVAEAQRCLECGICSECLQCEFACRAGAVRHDDREETVDLNVGAVILAPGLKTVAGNVRPEYGYAVFPNVITSLEFERMLSASGPYGGVVQRPSDGRHPRKIAFIQCVGSRDLTCGQDYCSSVCCMYTAKEAIMAREHDANVEPAIFYMDVRAFGKGFERYYKRAEHEQGVRYVRSMVSCVKEVPGSQDLRLLYATPDGKSTEETFDLVVLAMGLRPADGTLEMAERLGLRLNRFGFAESPPYGPAETNVPGVFVAGAFAAPKDIPETVIEASCAAAKAAALLAPARGTLARQPVYPEERNVSHEDARVGVFVCHCGINIGGVVRVPEVVDYVKSLPGVVYAEHNLYTCSQDTQERIKQHILEHGINRVVVASCTPRTHEPLFQDTIRQAGLNPHLFELANIREQDSWVHRADRDAATSKAKGLVAMAVAKAARLRPLYRRRVDMDHRALVVGGGPAGLTAALSLADQSFDVHLVEREEVLGGNLRHVRPGADASPQQVLADLIDRVGRNPRISVHLGARVSGVTGYVGQYRTTIRYGDGQAEELSHGAAIIATGGRASEPHEYLYGQHPCVITQRELESRLTDAGGTSPVASGSGDAESEDAAAGQGGAWVMIQCAGSREDAHPYCSRICCTQAIQNALAIKRRDRQAQVTILYRDIRTYGFRELLYQEARAAGVRFLQYNEDAKPAVAPAEHGLRVEVVAQPDGERFTLPADFVVLAPAIEPNDGAVELAQMFKVPLSEDGFFLEAHAKLRPLDFAADGVYLAGLAHSPRFVDETMAQAHGAAMRAAALLSRDQLQSAAIIASVNPRLCAACGICVDVCPYSARRINPDEGHAEVLEVLCQGCGACVAACPNGASYQRGFEFRQVFGMVDAALEEAWHDLPAGSS